MAVLEYEMGYECVCVCDSTVQRFILYSTVHQTVLLGYKTVLTDQMD